MKKSITLLAFITILASCNQKAKIVEQEKQVKSEMSYLQTDLDGIEYDRQKLYDKYKDTHFKSPEFIQEAGALKDKEDSLRIKKATLKITYDSLEMELKKY